MLLADMTLKGGVLEREPWLVIYKLRFKKMRHLLAESESAAHSARLLCLFHVFMPVTSGYVPVVQW